MRNFDEKSFYFLFEMKNVRLPTQKFLITSYESQLQIMFEEEKLTNLMENSFD